MMGAHELLDAITRWFAELDQGDWIGLAGICITAFFSVLTILQTSRTNKLDARLKELELEAAALAAEKAKSADISADFSRNGRSCHLKIFNRGPCAARNVDAELQEGAELVVAGEALRKLPVLLMEPHSGTYLICAPHMGSPPKLTIKLTWDDDKKQGNEKILQVAW